MHVFILALLRMYIVLYSVRDGILEEMDLYMAILT